MRLQIAQPTKHPDFLDLPWETPLQDWQSTRIVEVARGISRHVVRFVNYGGSVYALKEIPRRIAEREYKLLRKLHTQGLPVVEPVGVVTDRGGSGDDELDAILMTRHLTYALPYRTLFSGHGISDLRNSLLNALVDLLVRLHLAGFFWGDCSLSNTLFRRDAGGLAAYLVDAETGEFHTRLTDGQRRYDLTVAEQNIAGELMDIEAGFGLPSELDPVSTANNLPERYESLWTELNREEVFPVDSSYLIDARIHRLNELGFDVKEVEYITVGRGRQVKLHTQVVEKDHHQRQLQALTGLHVQENQARRLFNDVCNYRANVDRDAGRSLPMSVVAYRWLTEVFEPTIASIPQELRGKLEPAELYHQLLDHRWFLSEAAGRDVGREQAVQSYVETVLRHAPDERGLATLHGGNNAAEKPS